MPKPKKFAALRAVMAEYGYEQVELGRAIGRSLSYMNQRFCASEGKYWDLRDMYAIMHTLRLPAERLHEFFPPDGISQKQGRGGAA